MANRRHNISNSNRTINISAFFNPSSANNAQILHRPASMMNGREYICMIIIKREKIEYTKTYYDENGKKQIDWSQTKAVAKRSSYIYINLKGRDPAHSSPRSNFVSSKFSNAW